MNDSLAIWIIRERHKLFINSDEVNFLRFTMKIQLKEWIINKRIIQWLYESFMNDKIFQVPCNDLFFKASIKEETWNSAYYTQKYHFRERINSFSCKSSMNDQLNCQFNNINKCISLRFILNNRFTKINFSRRNYAISKRINRERFD